MIQELSFVFELFLYTTLKYVYLVLNLYFKTQAHNALAVFGVKFFTEVRSRATNSYPWVQNSQNGVKLSEMDIPQFKNLFHALEILA